MNALRSSALSLCVAAALSCRDNPRAPARRAPAVDVARAAPTTASAPPRAAPSVTADAAASPGEARAVADASSADGGVRVFPVAASSCVRDAARARLGAGVHGYFGNDRLELEVRNVRHACTPGPVFTASVEGSTVRVRYAAPSREALARCACGHDVFLQVVGIPRGDYSVEVAPMSDGDAGAPVATGRITASAP